MRISLECRPSFEGGWEVQLERRASEPWRVRVRLGHPQDGLSAHPHYDPETGTAQWERPLSPAGVAEIARLLKGTTVPLAPEFAMGLDGTTWELRIEYGWNRVHLAWWPELPRAWQSLRPLLDFLVSLTGAPWNPDIEGAGDMA